MIENIAAAKINVVLSSRICIEETSGNLEELFVEILVVGILYLIIDNFSNYSTNSYRNNSNDNGKSENNCFHVRVLANWVERNSDNDTGNIKFCKFLLDSCTDYIINNELYLVDLKVPVKIKMGDGHFISATRRGNVSVQLNVHNRTQ